MLCSSIKLADRRELLKELKTPTRRSKSATFEEKLFTKSDYYHSYTFRWDKPKKRHYSCNNPQYLTVKDIIFPEDLAISNNSPTKQWLKKTPKQKSIDVLPKMKDEELEIDEDDLNISLFPHQLSKESEDLIEEIKSTINIDEEMDPDIQKLILSTRELEQNNITNEEDRKKNEKKRKKQKKKEKNSLEDKSKTKTKTIKFDLSKPGTPQTLQVIRVDVTSNFSMEEAEELDTNRTDSHISDCSKGCGMKILKEKEVKEDRYRKASLCAELSENEVNFMCRRLTLKDRNDDVVN